MCGGSRARVRMLLLERFLVGSDCAVRWCDVFMMRWQIWWRVPVCGVCFSVKVVCTQLCAVALQLHSVSALA